jgi:hypothetical protein
MKGRQRGRWARRSYSWSRLRRRMQRHCSGMTNSRAAPPRMQPPCKVRRAELGLDVQLRREALMLTVKVRYDGKVFIPEGQVNLPPGAVLELPLPSPDEPTLIQLAKQLDRFPSDPDWPADMAAQHDHYLYGTPRRP